MRASEHTVRAVIDITAAYLQRRGHPDAGFVPDAQSALCQDAYIFGIDVDDYVYELKRRFGDVVYEIPWLRFTDQTSSFRGWASLIVPFWVFWRLARKLVMGGPVIPHPQPRAFPLRLELAHIAYVIEQGEWIEP
jgi:hypothetical protein